VRATRQTAHLQRSRRGSYFFVIDAFIAASILVLTLTLIFNFFTSQRQTEQVFTYAQDYLDFLASTQVKDYRIPEITQLIVAGNITNTRVTLAEQVLIFNLSGQNQNAKTILEAVAKSVPENVDLMVTLVDRRTGMNATLYSRPSSNAGVGKQNHLSARSLVYTVVNNTFYGPYAFRAEAWT